MHLASPDSCSSAAQMAGSDVHVNLGISSGRKCVEVSSNCCEGSPLTRRLPPISCRSTSVRNGLQSRAFPGYSLRVLPRTHKRLSPTVRLCSARKHHHGPAGTHRCDAGGWRSRLSARSVRRSTVCLPWKITTCSCSAAKEMAGARSTTWSGGTASLTQRDTDPNLSAADVASGHRADMES